MQNNFHCCKVPFPLTRVSWMQNFIPSKQLFLTKKHWLSIREQGFFLCPVSFPLLIFTFFFLYQDARRGCMEQTEEWGDSCGKKSFYIFWNQIRKNENSVFSLIYITSYFYSWKGRAKRKVKRFPFRSWMFSLLSYEFLQLFSTRLNYHISPNEISYTCLSPSHSRLFSDRFLSSCFWRYETWILL